MTCLEAQSKIMAFIENKLPDDELKEFIKHVKNCHLLHPVRILSSIEYDPGIHRLS